MKPRLFRSFARDRRGATAAEFGVVCGLFIAMALGSIDFARLAWEINAAKAAARAGARLLVVRPMLSNTLQAYNGTAAGFAPGESVPAGAVGPVTCTGSGATTFTCSDGGSVNATVSAALIDRMSGLYPGLTAANVQVVYTHVGLGFVGNLDGPDIDPLVTVRVVDVQFQPSILQVFGLDGFELPSMETTFSGEDFG